MGKQKEIAGDSLEQKNIVMAAKRTMLAAERTLMAWVRTGLSLIGFGFTIYQFLLFLQKEGMLLLLTPQGPRRLGIFLIGLGIFSLAIGSFQYWKISSLVAKEFHVPRWIFPLVISGLIALLGIILFISAVIKIRVL